MGWDYQRREEDKRGESKTQSKNGWDIVPKNHRKQSAKNWKHLDALFLTGLTGGLLASEIEIDAVVAHLDAYSKKPRYDTFHLDASPAFQRILRRAKESHAKHILYVDSVYTDPQTKHRYVQFKGTLADIFPDADHTRICCDTEHDIEAENLMRQLKKHPPDLVLGYIHPAWKKSILTNYGNRIHVYNVAAKGEESESIEVDYAAWAREIWSRTQQRIQQITLAPDCHPFPAT